MKLVVIRKPPSRPTTSVLDKCWASAYRKKAQDALVRLLDSPDDGVALSAARELMKADTA